MKKLKGLDNYKPQTPISVQKYLSGERSDDFYKVKHLKPVFAFDFLSLNKTEFCFNGELVGSRDLFALLKGLKSVSTCTYEQMSKEYRFHFHSIDWEDVSVSASDFYKCINGNYNGEEDITAYQFKVFEEARVIGFIYRGVFYLVMFDRGHNAYKRK